MLWWDVSVTLWLCRFTFWRRGQVSNPGIQLIAETGDGSEFLSEVEPCEAAGSCGPGEGFMCGEEPRMGVCQSQGEFLATPGYPYVSVATMIAPSPDWCALMYCPACALVVLLLLMHAHMLILHES